MSAPADDSGVPRQPRALLFLAFTEAWERFSYYGMTSILVLYMSRALLLPGRSDHVAGLAGLRAALESVAGPLSPLAFASQIYGLYAGFIYFTPVFGGLIADRLIGRRRAVLLGAVLMSAGHVAMAFDVSFLAALGLLIVGCGFLKGNISAQVGALYAGDDADGRSRGFALFSVAINTGAIAGPLLVGLLADRLGWHWGFAIAGVLMLVGLATYLAGYPLLVDRTPVAVVAAPGAGGQGRVVGGLAAVMALSTFQSVAYLQNSNIGLVWIADHVDLAPFGFRVPVGWFNALDPLASIAFVPVLFAWWRRHPQSELARIAQGAGIAALANLVLVAAAWSGGRVSVLYPLVYEVLLGIAFLHTWPTLLALVSRAAPPAINATLLGCVFLTLFVAGLLIGAIGGSYERIGPTLFWAVNAGIAAAGCAATLVLIRPLHRVLPRPDADGVVT